MNDGHKGPPPPNPDKDPSVEIKEGNILLTAIQIILVFVIGGGVIYFAASGRLDALWG